MSTFPHSQLSKAIRPDVWQADALAGMSTPVLATGDAVFDAQLPGGGWSIGVLNEILQPAGVHSEWRLLLPVLTQCGAHAVVLVGAPHQPFGPALQAQGLSLQRLLWVSARESSDRMWATEQALRCADVDAVVVWLLHARPDQLRRLQMAAAEYSKLLFVVRPELVKNESSPAVLRLWIGPSEDRVDALEVRVLKRRGPPMGQSLHLGARPARLRTLLAACQPGAGHALDRAAACV